jgi:preprotein translocase subunit SecD
MNLLVVITTLVGLLYALPNVYDQDPSMEITATRNAQVDTAMLDRVKEALNQAGIPYKGVERVSNHALVRFASSEVQLQAQDVVAAALGENYHQALTLAPDLPGWLVAFGAKPMYLGLDLRGGIHVVIDVDVDAAVDQALERYVEDIRGLLRKEKIRYLSVARDASGVLVKFDNVEARDAGTSAIRGEFRNLSLDRGEEGSNLFVQGKLNESEKIQIKKFALEQNITTLRNRVNALGVAEPVIQQQGERRIVVQLPGAQDPSKLKELLGATATLEYRLADTEHSVEDAVNGRVPPGSKLYRDRKGKPMLLKKQVIVTGNQITDASSGLDQRSGSPAVFVSLDGQGARRMRQVTTENVSRPMAVVFIETRTVTKMVDGQAVKVKTPVEEVISVANILEPFGRRFQTTGLDSTAEARDLALLLRAGALAAPIDIVEERTIGPSLGQDNIDKGWFATLIGLLLVLTFMAVYYRLFGLVADIAVAMNMVMLIAILSFLQATLTLPGIAGILLTIGMAVDANVLINERIREELRNGNTPQASIHAGYERAFGTILDSNITTLIAGVVLFSFGTGPVKGFAVTLSIGILTSMFTAIVGTRSIVNFIYGGKRVAKLSV